MDLNDDTNDNKTNDNDAVEKTTNGNNGDVAMDTSVAHATENGTASAVECNDDVVKSEDIAAGDATSGDVKSGGGGSKVVQITNVSPGATIQQLATLFGFLGTVTDIRLYPSEESFPPVLVKVCYVCFEDNEQCGVAQHLTNTVFIDKPLIVVPMDREEIPEESECQHLIKSINAYATMSNTGYLPNAF